MPAKAYFAFLLSNKLRKANKNEATKVENKIHLITSIGYLVLNSSVVKYSGKRKQITAPKEISDKKIDK